MKKEVFDTIKKESIHIGLLFIAALIIFKIAFFKENLLVLFKAVLSLFWMFVLPGYSIMLYWKNNLEFIERFIVGIAISAGITGALSYYFGLFGLNVKYHGILLPLTLIIIGFVIANRKHKN